MMLPVTGTEKMGAPLSPVPWLMVASALAVIVGLMMTSLTLLNEAILKKLYKQVKSKWSKSYGTHRCGPEIVFNAATIF
jgi:hypothetical protein